MPIAIDPKQLHDFTLARERGQEDAAVFQIHALTASEDEVASEAMKRSDAAFVNAVVRMGLGGWSRFKDEGGRDVPFDVDSNGKAKGSALNALTRSDRGELCIAITNLGSSAIKSAELER